MKGMLERVANEQEVKQAQASDVKVSDMLRMKPPKLWTIAVDNRIRGMLQSESSTKGKGKR